MTYDSELEESLDRWIKVAYLLDDELKGANQRIAELEARLLRKDEAAAMICTATSERITELEATLKEIVDYNPLEYAWSINVLKYEKFLNIARRALK
jgi:hypothetical protein